VLAESIKALKEALEQVLSLVHNLTLALVLLILQEPHGVALAIELLEEFINSLSGLVRMVDEEGLEIEKIEAGLW